MQNLDADGFGRLLTETAECYSQKAITPGAQRRWFEVLREIPYERVQGAMRVYMRTRQRMPTPADILGISESMGPRNVDIPAPEIEPHHAVTQHGRKCAAALRQFLAEGLPRPSKRWARDILDAHAEGVPLVYRHPISGNLHPLTGEKIADWQARFAQKGIEGKAQRLGLSQHEREPGEDDE